MDLKQFFRYLLTACGLYASVVLCLTNMYPEVMGAIPNDVLEGAILGLAPLIIPVSFFGTLIAIGFRAYQHKGSRLHVTLVSLLIAAVGAESLVLISRELGASSTFLLFLALWAALLPVAAMFCLRGRSKLNVAA